MTNNSNSSIRRSIADLRTLCASYVVPNSRVPDSVSAPHGFVRLRMDAPVEENWADVTSRAKRLESHGWIEWFEIDAGEGTYAPLTERGRTLLDAWRDVPNLERLLNPREGGGVPEFIEYAVENYE